jgi:hypothetical protein
MSTLGFIRAGGMLVIASGLGLGYSYIEHPELMPPSVIASSSWMLIHALFAVSLVLGLLGTTALYAVSARRTGWSGLVGYLLLFVGMMMIFGLDYYEVFIAPYLAVNYPQVIVDTGAGDTMGLVAIAFPVSGVLTVTGYALLGLAWRRASVVPGMLGNALVVTSIAFGVGLSPLGGSMLVRVTATLFAAALVAIGMVALFQKPDRDNSELY